MQLIYFYEFIVVSNLLVKFRVLKCRMREIILYVIFSFNGQLELVSERDHNFYDAFIFAIATHGGDGNGHRTDHVDSINEKGLFLTSDLVLVEYNKIINFPLFSIVPQWVTSQKYSFFIVAWSKEVDQNSKYFSSNHHYTTCHAANSSTPIYQDCMIISSSTSGDSFWGTVNEGSFFTAVFRHYLTDSELLESYHFQEMTRFFSSTHFGSYNKA